MNNEELEYLGEELHNLLEEYPEGSDDHKIALSEFFYEKRVDLEDVQEVLNFVARRGLIEDACKTYEELVS